ncbi:hypothetical protein Poly24_34260 [Rosistilla carotiformis]|uniref:Uncharacterized protein n=1 Tax=Rosistilla carotiformis TaxID=2528017 RepID=A0A518JVZ4_9BACT|nr:hypothetical protein [Rosistilla carotiformis]QDV69709.1 hypothetical protein Poly24_34260 [Rosistilla carotiformis]
MSNLSPQTAAKLSEFGSRQKRLLILRAVCVGIVSLLVLMSLVAVIDWMWILSSGTRWGLSLATYAIVIGLVWWTSLRRWFAPQDPESLAASFEVAEPELRENLLAAVELSKEEAASNGSSQFRQLLQDKVARNIGSVDVRGLLPVRLIGRWLVGAIAIACLFGILVSMPGWSFRQLITRAMIPGANLDRVSNTKVRVLQPSPASQIVPRGETVGVVVELSGPEVNEVTLESYSESTGLNRQMMRAQGERRFAANITVRDPRVDYRILAGDAITRHYSLKSRPRPRVEAFQKIYHYPDYTQLQDETITETNGDLIALEGTQVDLLLGTDQPVTKAQLVIETLGTDNLWTIDAIRREDGLLAATVPIRQAGVFKVLLESEETGFENTFSPKYEIRPEPDMIPRVGFLQQQETTLLRPANDIVPLMAMAEDDLPLDTLRQMVSVNGGRWIATPLEITPAAQVTKNWEMDLLALKVKSGDTVSTKMVAIDRKGQRGESVPLKIVITSDDFDANRHDALTVKAFVADRLAQLAIAVTTRSDNAEEIFKRNQETRRLSPADQVALMDIANQIEQETADAAAVVATLMPKIPAGLDAYDLELTLRMLSQIQRELAAELKSFIPVMNVVESDGKIKSDRYKHYHHHFKQAGETARWLDDRFRTIVSHDLMAGVAIDLDGIYQLQQALIDSGDRFSETRLRRHQQVAINYVHALEDLMEEHAPRIRQSTERTYRGVQEMVARFREQMQLALDNADDHGPLQRVTEQFAQELHSRLSQSMADGSLPEHLGNARRDLAQRTRSLADPIDLTIREAQELAQTQEKLLVAKDSDDVAVATEANRLQRDAFDWRLASMRDQVADRRKANELRPDPLPSMVADLSLLQRAIDHVFTQWDAAASETETQQTLEHMRIIRDAFRQLEAGHRIAAAQPLAGKLLAEERWDSQSFASRIEGPRLWDGISKEIEIAAADAKSARYPDEVVHRINELRWGGPLDKAGQMITMRRWRREVVSAATGVETMVNRFQERIVEIAPIMADARKRIADLIPSIPQLAETLADKARQLEEETAALAEEAKAEADKAEQQPKAEEKSAEAAAEQAAEKAATEAARQEKLEALQEEQQSLTEELQALLAALAEDASNQDLMEEEGRQRARDADDSIGMIQQPAEKSAQELQAAAESPAASKQAEALQEAAKQQEQLADALDQVGEHFEKLDAGEDVAESREALRQAETELPNGRELAKEYARLERLSDIAERAESEQEKLLAQLERELQKSPEMQAALSDIAAEATAQALQALDFAKQQEDETRRALERSDPTIRAEKQKLQQDLQQVAREAAAVADRMLAVANNQAKRADQPKTAEKANQAREQLQSAANEARQLSENNLLSEMQQAAADVNKKLQEAMESVKQVSQEAKQAADDEVSDQKQKDRMKRDAENDAKQLKTRMVQEARQAEQHADNYQRQADQRIRSAEANLRNQEREAATAEQEAKKYPDSQWHQENAENTRRRVEETRKVAEAEKQLSEDAKQRKKAASESKQQMEKMDLGKFDAANPAAQLAQRVAEKSAEMIEQMAQKMEAVADSAIDDKQLASTVPELEAAQRKQESLGEDVQVASEDLARAARHEKRMNQSPATAAKLDKAAQEVAKVAENQIAAAENKAAQAAEKARKGEDKPEGDAATPAAQAAEAIQQARDAIGEQAEGVADMLAQSQAAKAAAEQRSDASPSETNPSTAESAATPANDPADPSNGNQANEASPTGQPPAGQTASAKAPAGESGNPPPASPTGDSPANDEPASAAGSPSGEATASASPPAGQGGQSPTASRPNESTAARGQRLAEMLDDLDRAIAAAANQSEPSGQSGQPTSTPSAALPSIAEMAANQAAAMSKRRSENQQPSGPPTPPGEAAVAEGEGAELDQMSDQALAAGKVDRSGSDWGKLREQNVENATAGNRSEFASQYSDQIKAYFKVIAERSRK